MGWVILQICRTARENSRNRRFGSPKSCRHFGPIRKKAKKNHRNPVAAQSANSDRSGEKPYCTFIICIRFHFVNDFFASDFFCWLARIFANTGISPPACRSLCCERRGTAAAARCLPLGSTGITRATHARRNVASAPQSPCPCPSGCGTKAEARPAYLRGSR